MFMGFWIWKRENIMKLSCLPVSFFKEIIEGSMSVHQWALLGRELGLDGIDLSVLFLKSLDQEYLESMRGEMESAGIGAAVVNTYPDLTHPEYAERRRERVQLKGYIRAAGVLGALMVRVTAGQGHPETDRRNGVQWAVEGLAEALETADPMGMTLVYENHSKPGVWQHPDFSYPSEIFLEIAGRLEGTSLRILFDTANPVSRGEDPIPILERVMSRVACVHAADTSSAKGLRPALLGTGIVPFDDIFSLLKKAGYDGWISIEEASGLGRRGVKKAVAFVRSKWKETE